VIEAAEGPRSFTERQLRYFSPYDLMQVLKRTFPGARAQVTDDCRVLTDVNRSVLGDDRPATGSPVFSDPSSSFVRWYAMCLDVYLKAFESFTTTDAEKARAFYGATLDDYLSQHPDARAGAFVALPTEIREAAVREQVERMIGPDEVVADFGYHESVASLATEVLNALSLENTDANNISINEAMKKLIYLIAFRDEFLSY